MNIRNLAFFAIGYVFMYYGLNVLTHAYFGTMGTPLNPPPLSVLFGIPGAPSSSAAGGGSSGGGTPASNPGISDNLNIPNPLTGSTGQ